MMFLNISNISFIDCSLRWLVNERNKQGVTFSGIRARVKPVLQTKPYVHSTTTITHCKDKFG